MHYPCGDSQLAGDPLDQRLIEVRQPVPLTPEVDAGKKFAIAVEERRLAIQLFQRAPVLALPVMVRKRDLVDTPVQIAAYRNGHPLRAVRGLDAVAVSPVVLRELH